MQTPPSIPFSWSRCPSRWAAAARRHDGMPAAETSPLGYLGTPARPATTGGSRRGCSCRRPVPFSSADKAGRGWLAWWGHGKEPKADAARACPSPLGCIGRRRGHIANVNSLGPAARAAALAALRPSPNNLWPRRARHSAPTTSPCAPGGRALQFAPAPPHALSTGPSVRGRNHTRPDPGRARAAAAVARLSRLLSRRCCPSRAAGAGRHRARRLPCSERERCTAAGCRDPVSHDAAAALSLDSALALYCRRLSPARAGRGRRRGHGATTGPSQDALDNCV